jgi:hypothetical protein
MFPRFYKILLLILFACSFTFAQSGRISGKVTDQQTGEPLIGANIIVMGTSLGAASDVNGEYLITNLSPGQYSVKASYIGYRDLTINNVLVTSGLTTRLNFELQSAGITTGEVVIVSQRPLIEKTSTNAIRRFGPEDMENLGLRTLNSIVQIQPGVVTQNGVTYVRGSRPDETGYTVEGADTKNILSRNGGSLVTVTPAALQEVLVQAGGYTAEFGNANAGIISSEFKTGTSQYKFSFMAVTDNFGNYPGKKFLGTYSYGYSDYVFTVSGPVFTDKLKVFLSAENQFNRDTPKFFDANPETFSDGAPLATTKVYDTGVYGGSTSDYQYLTWGAANIAGNADNRYTFNGTVLFDNNPLLIRLAGAFTWQRNQGTNGIFNIFNSMRIGMGDASNLLLNLKGTYLLGSNSFVEANVGLYDGRTKNYDPIFKDNYLLYSDSLAASQYGWYPQASYSQSSVAYDFYGFPFNRPGTQQVGWNKSHDTYINASVSYTGQIEKHAIKVGGSFQRYTIRRYALTGVTDNFLTSLRANPDYARDSLKALLLGPMYNTITNYGFDVLGNESDESGVFAPKHPLLASGYVQDRFEINDLVINAGLRYDHIDMDSWKWEDPSFPEFNLSDHTPTSVEKGDVYDYISPRIGFAFPVTDRTVFHLQFGKFVQAPALDQVYIAPTQIVRQFLGANLFGNAATATNPQPIRTTQYEIGFSQQISDFASIDITAFYKDIKGQLQYAVVNTAPGAIRNKYNIMANQDFATNTGLEFAFKMRRVERVSAAINYTYSSAQGTNSGSGSSIGSTEVNGNSPTVLLPLDYDQTHRGSIILDYRFDKGDGGPVLEQLGLNAILTFNSGHPFTYSTWQGLGQSSAWTGGLTPIANGDTRGRRPYGPINSSTTPWVYNIDLRIDKTFSIYKFDVNLFVQVTNLLNTKSVINVYDKTGNAEDDGFLSTTDAATLIANPRYTERFADLYRAVSLGNRAAAYNVYGFDVWGPPRQLFAGVMVNF